LIGIYQIKNLLNGKCYIGLSNDLTRRAKQHKGSLLRGTHTNKHLQASFNLFGLEQFVCNIIEVCLEEDLIRREKYWIRKLATHNGKYGYNMTHGGEYKRK